MSDKFLSKPSRLGLLAALLLGSGSAWAQVPEAPAPAPVPAADDAANRDAPGGDAPAGAEPAAAQDAAAEAEPGGAQKKKKRKHKLTDDDRDAPLLSVGTETGTATATDEPGDKKRNKAKHDFRIKGRVFALAELSHRRERVLTVEEGLVDRDTTALHLGLQSGRFGVDYQSPLPWLSAEIELEVAGKVEVKDAFLKAGDRFFAKAGRFKVPTAAMEVASPWTLPQVKRGLVHNLLVDWMDVGGRAPGLALGYRERTGLKPRLTLGVFQGSTLDKLEPGDRDVTLLDRTSLHDQLYAARGEISPFGVALGAWYLHRINSIALGKAPHFSTFGLDATWQRTFERGGVRAWVDGGGGKSPYLQAQKPGDGSPAWFAFGRAQLAYRFGGVAQGEPYVEPFGFFAIMDPDTEVVSDMVTEAALGLSVGFWDRARITLQGDVTNGQRNVPSGFLAGQNPDRKALFLQAGARF